MEKLLAAVKLFLPHMNEITAICVYLRWNLWQYFLSLSKIYITEILEEKLPEGKLKLLWEAPLRFHLFFLNSSSV